METDWIKRELTHDSGDSGPGAGGFFSEASYRNRHNNAPGGGRQQAEGSERRSERLLLGMAGVVRRNVLRGDYSDFDAGKNCPFCMARQSWVQPMPVGSMLFSVAITMVISVLVAVVLGGLLSSMGLDWALLVFFAIGIAAGVFLSLVKVIRPYLSERKLTRAAGGNKVRNLPEIDWDVYRDL